MVEAEKGNSTTLFLIANQLEALQQLLSQTKVHEEVESAGNNLVVSLTKEGNTSHSLLSQKFSTNFWIIDIGALDHMTGSPKILSNYEPCDLGISVFKADGTTSLDQGRGIAYIAGLT